MGDWIWVPQNYDRRLCPGHHNIAWYDFDMRWHSTYDRPANIIYRQNGTIRFKSWDREHQITRGKDTPALLEYYEDGSIKKRNGSRWVILLDYMTYLLV